MCGIAGIYNYKISTSTIDRSELNLIDQYQSLRGPDAKGLWYSENERIGLSHRRLSIVDLHDNSDQPMVSALEGLTIVFNGEIYNYRELRQQLITAGHRFTTQSDTEVLLQAYSHWGEGVLSHLRGMYAFAIWDNYRKRLFLARDPYGIKPLYYANDGRTVRFASQVKALLAGGAVPTAPSPPGIVGFLMMGSVPEPHTVYKHIAAVPAGCFMFVDDEGVHPPERFFLSL